MRSRVSNQGPAAEWVLRASPAFVWSYPAPLLALCALQLVAAVPIGSANAGWLVVGSTLCGLAAARLLRARVERRGDDLVVVAIRSRRLPMDAMVSIRDATDWGMSFGTAMPVVELANGSVVRLAALLHGPHRSGTDAPDRCSVLQGLSRRVGVPTG